MKKITFFIACLSLVTFMACNKSNAKRIVGTWKATKVMEGAKDVTTDWTKNSYTETYASGDGYSYTGQPDGKSGSGKYAWDNETVLKRSGVSGQSSVTCTITTLDKSNLSFSCVDNGTTWQFSFQKQ